jgi:hypothetical protein
MTGMMKITHGEIWGRHNRSFLVLFITVFVLLFVPLAMRLKAARGISVRARLQMAILHLTLGAALGYLASILAFAGVTLLGRLSGFSQPVEGHFDVLNVAAVLFLNNYGWLFGVISFAVFDVVTSIFGIRANPRTDETFPISDDNKLGNVPPVPRFPQ